MIFAIKKQHSVDEKVVSRNSSAENIYVARFSCIFSRRFLVVTIISCYDMALTLK